MGADLFRRAVWIAGLCCLALACTAGPAPAQKPAPVVRVEHWRETAKPPGFTQGLFFHRGRLYETLGLYGRSRIRRFTDDFAAVADQAPLPEDAFAEGACVLHGRLYVLTWKKGLALVLDPESFETLERLRYFGQGWGLTTDGASLIMSNGTSSLAFRDPGDLSLLDSVVVRDAGREVDNLNELEWVEGYVLANVWGSSRVAVVEPESGRVALWLDFAGPARGTGHDLGRDVLNGLAWDGPGDRLAATGKNWPKLVVVEGVRALLRGRD